VSYRDAINANANLLRVRLVPDIDRWFKKRACGNCYSGGSLLALLTRDPIEHVSNADNGVYSTTSLGGARDTAWIATPSRLYHPTLTPVRCN